MASSVDITYYDQPGRGLQKVKFEWVSHTDGVVTGVATTRKFHGELVRFVTVPSGGGTAPTDDYDITITDEDGVDVLVGAGANRDTANTEQVLGSSLGAVYHSTLTFAVANAGSAKEGTAYLYIR